jgi:hypothetical protein
VGLDPTLKIAQDPLDDRRFRDHGKELRLPTAVATDQGVCLLHFNFVAGAQAARPARATSGSICAGIPSISAADLSGSDVSALTPIFTPIGLMAAHGDSCPAWCYKSIRSAHFRTSEEHVAALLVVRPSEKVGASGSPRPIQDMTLSDCTSPVCIGPETALS